MQGSHDSVATGLQCLDTEFGKLQPKYCTNSSEKVPAGCIWPIGQTLDMLAPDLLEMQNSTGRIFFSVSVLVVTKSGTLN